MRGMMSPRLVGPGAGSAQVFSSVMCSAGLRRESSLRYDDAVQVYEGHDVASTMKLKRTAQRYRDPATSLHRKIHLPLTVSHAAYEQ